MVFPQREMTWVGRGDDISAVCFGTRSRGGGGWVFCARSRICPRVLPCSCSATSERGVLLAAFVLVRDCSGGWGWKTPSGVRGGAPRCWGCCCSWPQDSKGGRGLVRAAWLPPGELPERPRGMMGGNHASLPARLELFFAGGYGGAWNGAQAEVVRGRNRLAVSPLRGRALPEPERSGTRRSARQKKNMVFTLSWTVRAKRVPLRHHGPRRF